MKKTFLFVFFVSLVVTAQDYRYTETLFESSTVLTDVVYGNAPFINAPFHDESNTTNGDLIMDIYMPTNDSQALRPAIIFAHSGAFLNGNRNHEDMVALCDSLARKGYVTATIDYRKSFYLISNASIHGTRAVYRGIQDGRSAIRFLRANAATYGIDPEKVYLGGSSAGAFIALHAAYMNDPDEQPIETEEVTYTNLIPPFAHSGPDMGPVDVGDHLSEDGQPNAIISLWGALQSTSLISSEDTIPVFLAHGTDDSTVLFNTGSPFGFPPFPEVDGSNPINDHLDALGFTQKDTYFVENEGHEFYGTDNGNWPGNPNQYWEPTVNKTVNFLWLQHKPLAQFSEQLSTNFTLDFTDESNGALAWWWDFGDGNFSNEQNPTHTYASEGTYDVKLYIENDILSWDEVTREISVEEVLSATEFDASAIRIYPNPAHDLLYFESALNMESATICNALGQSLFTTTETQSIDISLLAAGVYFVQVKSNDTKYVKRFIKE